MTDLHSGPAFLHKDIKTCTNRKPATQNSLLKKASRWQFRGGIPGERETTRSKSQKGWHKSSIHDLYKALCAHKAQLYVLVQTEQDFFMVFNPAGADE